MADIFREIEEDLRHDKLMTLWRRYGALLVAAAVAIVLATAGYVAWNHFRDAARQERARLYDSAMELLARDDPGAIEKLGEIGAGSDGYAVLARLQEAARKAKQGDDAGALAVYEAIASDGGERAFRDLAVILIALHTLDEAEPEALIRRLEPLTAEGNAWRYSALELTALLARRAGEVARAREIFVKLADDQQAPAALRQRATELLNALPS